MFVRQPQVRYTVRAGDHGTVQFAAENPETNLVTLGAVDDDVLPDFVGRYSYSNGSNAFSLAGLVRALNVESGGVAEEAVGWGVSLAGKIGLGDSSDLRGMLTGGEGIGRYIGLGYAADGVVVSGSLDASQVIAGFVSFRHAWSPRLRSSVTYSAIGVDYDVSLPTQSSGSWSAAANLFFEPVPGLMFGTEYRHAERELFSGVDGSLDRLHLTARQNF